MSELLTAAQMRAIEQAAIVSGAVTGLELMERAGRGVVEAIFERWPEFKAGCHHAAVLCGPGNNGGDGFVIARLLKEQGWRVDVFLYGQAEKMPNDAKTNYERWVTGNTVKILDQRTVFDAGSFELCIDAVFGAGLTRALPRQVFGALDGARRLSGDSEVSSGVRRVAVDSPSGLDLDSGALLCNEMWDRDSAKTVLRADLTVTFHSLKQGHHLADGPSLCGQLVCKDIGLEKRSAKDLFGAKVTQLVAEKRDVAFKIQGGHKYHQGHALVVSGPCGMGGAARLAARGALRIGAGLVSVVCDADAVAEHAAQLNAIMIKAADDATQFAKLLKDPRLNALCLGPGLGFLRARNLVPIALAKGRGPGSSPGRVASETAEHVPAPEPGPPWTDAASESAAQPLRAILLDADALTAFVDAPGELFAMLDENCVITPHAGEFNRLFPDIARDLETPPCRGPAYSKVDAARDAAARAGCIVVLKGPDTVIASPAGCAVVNSAHYDRAAPWLATAGSGDVLAGFITGLLARGFAPMHAAQTAVWLHVECARSFGPGLIAEDLPEELPRVLRRLRP